MDNVKGKRNNLLKYIAYNEFQFFSLLLSCTSSSTNLKVLDVMIFKKENTSEKSASFWIYTTPSGQLRSRNLEGMDIGNLILAVLCNIEGNNNLTHDCVIVILRPIITLT